MSCQSYKNQSLANVLLPILPVLEGELDCLLYDSKVCQRRAEIINDFTAQHMGTYPIWNDVFDLLKDEKINAFWLMANLKAQTPTEQKNWNDFLYNNPDAVSGLGLLFSNENQWDLFFTAIRRNFPDYDQFSWIKFARLVAPLVSSESLYAALWHFSVDVSMAKPAEQGAWLEFWCDLLVELSDNQTLFLKKAHFLIDFFKKHPDYSDLTFLHRRAIIAKLACSGEKGQKILYQLFLALPPEKGKDDTISQTKDQILNCVERQEKIAAYFQPLFEERIAERSKILHFYPALTRGFLTFSDDLVPLEKKIETLQRVVEKIKSRKVIDFFSQKEIMKVFVRLSPVQKQAVLNSFAPSSDNKTSFLFLQRLAALMKADAIAADDVAKLFRPALEAEFGFATYQNLAQIVQELSPANQKKFQTGLSNFIQDENKILLHLLELQKTGKIALEYYQPPDGEISVSNHIEQLCKIGLTLGTKQDLNVIKSLKEKGAVSLEIYYPDSNNDSKFSLRQLFEFYRFETKNIFNPSKGISDYEFYDFFEVFTSLAITDFSKSQGKSNELLKVLLPAFDFWQANNTLDEKRANDLIIYCAEQIRKTKPTNKKQVQRWYLRQMKLAQADAVTKDQMAYFLGKFLAANYFSKYN